jgi:hypothetical protein
VKNARVAVWCAVLPLAAAVSCAKVEPTQTGGGGGRSGGGMGGRMSTTLPPPMPCPGDPPACTDFPADPVPPDDPNVPANPGSMAPFNGGTPPAGNTLCITEPENNTLFPNNWLRPRVKFANPGRELAQIRMKAENQANELIAYTTEDNWKMPKEIWNGLRIHQTTKPVVVTVWLRSGAVGTTQFLTAPVSASGKMVFWAANPYEKGKDLGKVTLTAANRTALDGDSELLGFAVGEEGTVSALKISQVQQMSKNNDGNPAFVRCIGCHVGTPDGAHVAFNDAWPWRMATASIEMNRTGTAMPQVGGGGLQDLQQAGLGISAFSPAHWSAGDYIMITSYGKTRAPMDSEGNPDEHTKNPTPKLAWFDLGSAMAPWADVGGMKDPRLVEGTHMGFITRTGDTRGAASPTWSHDGEWIVYSSTASSLDGRLNNGETDLYKVPYASRLGGQAAPLAGAADADYWEYYPAFSPDDKLVAFTRAPRGQEMYANPNAEIWITPFDGSGPAFKLYANNPPECSGKKSPGVNNHWARWSPSVQVANDGVYYWIIFSSTRAGQTVPTRCVTDAQSCYFPPGGPPPTSATTSHLYIAAVIKREIGWSTTPAIYLWNQPADKINTTPAWEEFKIPKAD